MSKRKPKPVIVAYILQGNPHVLLDPDCERPAAWSSIKAADKAVSKALELSHFGISSADSVVAINVDTGESELLL